MNSREVSAVVVYGYVAPALIFAAQWPACGTPAWVALPNDDPRKIAAVYHAALQYVLAEDIAQDAERQASKAISACTDWRAVAAQLRQGRGSAYIRKTALDD